MSTDQLPGLQMAVKLLAQIGDDDSDAAIAAVHDLAEAHAQRLTLQHHAADQAQRIADLEAKCCALKRMHDAAADERDALRARLAEITPVPAQAVPDADGARFRWLCEDHSDRETREQCRSLIDRLSGMSYSAAVMSIDAAMAAAPEHKA